jgi:hypothetical protein
VGVGYRFGDGVDIAKGRRVWWRPSATLRLGRRFEAYGIHTYDKLSVPEGMVYQADLSELRTTYSFTNRAFLRAVVQYRHTARDPEAR